MQSIKSAQRAVGLGPEKTQMEQMEDDMCAFCPKLTYTQRIIGFCSCWGGGYLLSFCSTIALWDLSSQGLTNFAVLYVLGNCIALCATGFLVGPRQQCHKMFDPTRRIACVIYLVLLITVFVLAMCRVNVWLIIFVLIIEMMAATWYALSYIPWGRKMCIEFFKALPCIKPCVK